jgi:CBS domain-containing protein
MSKKVIHVDPECSVTEVVGKLHAYRISCVVVCEEGAPIGVITERDIVGLAFSLLSGKDQSQRSARDLMSSSMTTARASDSCDDAASLAEQERIRHLPVVDDTGQLVGLVTQSDLLRATTGYSR